MINKLLEDIVCYIDYLKKEKKLWIAFHNKKIPLKNDMYKLAPYNINSNPYCLLVKSDEQAWNHCIYRQTKIYEKCKQGPFIGTCYAGMGELVFPISDGEVLGFINISGFRIDKDKSPQYINRISREYQLSRCLLEKSYQENLRELDTSIGELKVVIEPLCDMFVLLNRELTMLYGENEEINETSDCILSHAIVYINRNISGTLMATDIAQACHCSVSYISHIFKQRMKKSISDYVNELRMKKAVSMLKNTSLTIRQISEMTGYNNQNYFSKVFHDYYNETPKKFRANELNSRNE